MDHTKTIDLHIHDLRQLFNTIDATPFPETDLDADADEFIVSWANEMPRRQPIVIRIFFSGSPTTIEHDEISTAISNYYAYRGGILQRQLRQLLGRGQISLIIGLIFLASTTGAAQLIDGLSDSAWSNIVREGLIIGGWVAMWGPLQILLYDWWPLRHRRQTSRRLADAKIEIHRLADNPSHRPLNSSNAA